MSSKSRLPPPQFRRPLPGPDIMHSDPFGPTFRPRSASLPFDMMHPEAMEQKLAMQDVEMNQLAVENQRLAATHSTLRKEFGAAQQELQRLQTHIGAVKAEKEQHLRALTDKIAMMEAELQASGPLEMEVEQAHAEAQNFVTARQEVMSKMQQLTQDLQRKHVDLQQIPALVSELEALRQEYQHFRATYDYERKLRIDHFESIQLMEQNYVFMVREVEKLRTELSNVASIERSGGSCSNTGYKENDASAQHFIGQNAYENIYGVSQGWGASVGATPYAVGPAGPTVSAAASTTVSYDPSRPVTHDASRAANTEPSRSSNHDTTKAAAAGYEASRENLGYEALRISGYEASRGGGAAQVGATTGANSKSDSYGAGQSVTPYGLVQNATAYAYGSEHSVATYVPRQHLTPYVQGPNPLTYVPGQNPNPYTTTNVASTYGSGQTPAYPGTGYEANHGGNAAHR